MKVWSGAPAAPNTVCMPMPCVMYIIVPASATALSPGSSSTSTNCISLPWISKSMSCARRPGTRGGAFEPAAPGDSVAAKRGIEPSGIQPT
jgi:hypothetical protein